MQGNFFISLIFVLSSTLAFSQQSNTSKNILEKAEQFLSQNTDSCSYYLNQVDSNESPEIQGYYHYIKANLLMKKGDFGKAISFFDKANKINKSTSKILYINGLHKTGLSLMYTCKYKKALSFFNKEILLEKENNTIVNTPKAYGNMAAAYRRLDKIDSAIFFNKKALKIYRQQKDSARIVSILNNLGNLYQAFDLENSNNYYNEALAISYRLPNMERRTAIIKENIGINLVENKQYNKALKYLEESYQYFLKTENKIQQAFVLNNIAFSYLNTNQAKKAISFTQKAIDIYQTNENKNGKAFAFLNLADAYFQTKQYKKSTKYYQKSLELANDLNEIQLKSKAYLGLFWNALQRKKIKQSADYFKKYIATKDSIYEDKKIKYLTQYKTELNLEKTQHQLELAEKDKKIKAQKLADNQILLDKQKLITKLYTLFSIVLILSIILLIIFFRKQKKINSLLKQHKEELNDKNKIIAHHNKNLELTVKEKTQSLINEIERRKIIEKELIIAKNEAEESDRLKSEFLSNISHEIRTPLNSIMGFSDILAETDFEEEDIVPYANIIRKNGFLLLGIINDLIDVAKIESGVLKTNIENHKLATLLDEIKEELNSKLKYLGKEDKIEIRYNFPNSFEKDEIQTDNWKFITIFNRLLNNAVQYTEEGFIEIGYKKTANQYNFYITDTGIGIPPERLHQIFKNFRKFRKTENFNYRGLGVGLFIAHKLLQTIDSQLEVKSVVNQGSTFYFTL